MAIIDVIKFDGLLSRDWLVYKYPGDDFATTSRLIVGEGQVAVFVKGGQILDIFTAGAYVLETENIPLLKTFANLPFGSQTPFTAEIYYINRTTKMDILWGTSDPIQIIDPKYNIKLRIRVFGQLAIKIEDYRLFFVELIGTLGSRDVVAYNKVLDFYKGILVTKIKVVIAKIILLDKISALEISAYLDDISSKCLKEMEEYFDKYGIKIVNLFIKSINFPDDDFAAINRILAEKASFDIIGDQRYTAKRSFDVMETAAGNEGGVAGVGIGAGIGLGMGAAMSVPSMSTAHNLNTQAHLQNQTVANLIACGCCGVMNNPAGMYCSNCGNNLKPTPKYCHNCKSEVIADAKFCSSCGTSLQKPLCPKCQSENTIGAKFCNSCGQSLL